jgi:N-methylhydantoinase B/oxoprolinase/acetone carboxylase alpha subunit
MGKLFDAKARLFDELIYDTEAYGRQPGCDPELIVQGLSPISHRERRALDSIDDIELDLLNHKLNQIVEEGRDVYMSLSISEGIITGDMNCGLFSAGGDPVSVATGIYFHVLLNNAQLKYINKYYANDPSVGLRDGDMFFFNDELGGGVHPFDMFTAMPIFYQGELVAWAEVGGHQGDTGSINPGGFSPKATQRWEEGLHIPVMRIGENCRLRQDILDFMCASVRNPFVFAADLKSRLATMTRIRERFLREVERRGVDKIVGGMRKILISAEQQARKRLTELNDGIYRHVLFNDDMGTVEGLTRIPTIAFKEGDQLTVLVQGVSPENHCGPMHATWHLVRAAMGVYLFSYFFRGLLPNAGLLQPVKVLVEGPSIANSTAYVAHGEGTSIAACVVQSLQVIGSKILFSSDYREGVQSPHSRNVLGYIYAGENARGYQTANFTGTNNAAGGGGRFDSDAESALGFYWGPFTDSGEVEDNDSRMPHLMLGRVIDKNYHGFGKYRGGAPLVEIGTPCAHRGCFLTSWGSADRLSHNPGLMGGYYGPPNPRFIIRNSDLFDRIRAGEILDIYSQYDLLTKQPLKGEYILEASPQNTQKFQEGDLFISAVGGGGGYGDVLEREPDQVLKDLREQMITPDIALNVYGVVLDTEGIGIDRKATEARRRAIRDERLCKGKPFREFMAEWKAKRPAKEIVEYYGHYPEPRVSGYDKDFWGLYD